MSRRWLAVGLIAGVLSRNFINARMVTLNRVIEECQAGDRPTESCLLIPNFFIPKSQGGKQADYRVQILYGLLIERHSDRNMNILYVHNWSQLHKEYGSHIAKHLEANYEEIEL